MQKNIVKRVDATACARRRCFGCNLPMENMISFGEATCPWSSQSVWIIRGYTVHDHIAGSRLRWGKMPSRNTFAKISSAILSAGERTSKKTVSLGKNYTSTTKHVLPKPTLYSLPDGQPALALECLQPTRILPALLGNFRVSVFKIKYNFFGILWPRKAFFSFFNEKK